MISARGLCKDFGELRAVEGVDFEIARGEFFAFLGPNAAGKTTTIRMLTGLLKPTAGEVRIGGFDMHREPEKAKAARWRKSSSRSSTPRRRSAKRRAPRRAELQRRSPRINAAFFQKKASAFIREIAVIQSSSRVSEPPYSALTVKS